MSENEKKQPEQKTPAKKKRSHLRRLSLFILKLCFLIIVMSGLALTWMYKTQSGTRTALALIENISLGSLKFRGVQGTLDDELKLDEFSLVAQDLHIDGSAISLRWRPGALWRRQLDITSLQLSALTIASRSSKKAASVPVDIGLPFSLSAPKLALGRLHIATMTEDGKQLETLKLSALTGSFSYQDNLYKAQTAFSSPWGNLKGEAALGSHTPFKLDSHLSLQGQVQEDIPPVILQGVVSGNLHDMQIALEAALDSAAEKNIRNQNLQGHARGRINSFTAPYVRELDIDVQHFDPSAWQVSAPHADLRILTKLKPIIDVENAEKNAEKNTAKNAKKNTVFGLTGPINIQNSQVASINKQGLPVQSLSTKLFWQGQHLSLTDLAVQLAAKGKLQGQADVNWQAAQLQADLKLNLANVDLNQIDQRLHASNIKGQFSAQTAKDKSINLQAQLQDARASLKAEASYLPEKLLLDLNKFDLQAENAHLQGAGDISFASKQAFNIKASLKDFDPARWVATPAGRLQADFSARGQLSPRLDVQVNLQQLQGQYAGQPVQAALDARWLQDQQLQVRQLDAHFGKNTVTAQGNWGGADDSLKFNIDAQDLSHLNPLLSNWQLALGGNLKADAVLRGRFNEPAGSLDAVAQQIVIKRGKQQFTIAQLKSSLNLANGAKGQFDGELVAQHLGGDLPALSSAPDNPDKLAQVSLKLQGRRDAHKLSLETIFPNKQALSLVANGSMQASAKNDTAWSWNGQLQALNLNGNPDLRLQSSAPLQVSAQSVRLGSLSLQSALGKLELEELEWTPAALKTKGQISDVQVLEIAKLFYPQNAVTGNLRLNAQWKLQLTEQAQGEIRLQRQSGDLRFNDPEGTGTSVALGIRDVQLQMKLGGLVAGSDSENLSLDLLADGSRLGQWQAKLNSRLSKQNDAWTILASAPLSGQVTAAVPDLQWLGPFVNSGLVLKGKLNADARLSGTIGKPGYRANLAGREMEIAFASEGLLLPNGSLDAQIEDKHLKLTNLQFSNTVANMPRHAQFRDENWIGRKGEFKASGDIDMGKETGSIQAQWTQFPLLQRKDRWLLVSGQANIVEANNIWSLTGKVLADGAYFRLPKLPPPSLSSDVVVVRKTDKAVTAVTAATAATKTAEADSNRKGLKTRIDVSFDMGPRFVFVGRGLDTGLEGSLRLRSSDGSPLQANGSIRTVKGAYEGYGQQLAIERGILNFQGPPANPGLNIRALRKGLPVEAGVEVAGTVSAPQVRLVSEPEVPDAEKLSWLVLGRGSDQLASGDASLLMSAATAIFGGDGSRNVPRDIVQGLGFDEFSIGSSSNGSGSRLPVQTIAGSTGTTNAATDQVVSVGKRIMPGLVLSVERGLSDASGGIKLSWQLTRRISITGRTGAESAVDVNYTFSFN